MHITDFYAGQVNHLIVILLAVSAFFFVVVIGATVFFAIRYRSSKVDAPTSNNRGFLPLEMVWFVVPLVVAGILAGVSANDVLFENNPPSNAMVVNVVGHRFRWTFEYPDQHVKTTGELHLPVGKNVKLNISSDDVIHSFWVPAFRIKEDAVPGIGNTFIWLKPEQIGTYDARCAQLCGIGHYLMTATVTVESTSDFNAWIAKQQGGQSNGGS